MAARKGAGKALEPGRLVLKRMVDDLTLATTYQVMKLIRIESADK